MGDLVHKMADTLDTDEAEAGRKAMRADWPWRQPKQSRKEGRGERTAREGSLAQPADEVSSLDSRLAMPCCRKRSLTGWSSAQPKHKKTECSEAETPDVWSS